MALLHRAALPPGQRPRGLVLYLRPFAEELNKSRRVAGQQARLLAQAGLHVLQLDLAGCGDSEETLETTSWAAWLDDAAQGVKWLRQLEPDAGCPIWLWGLRAGALLAADLLHLKAADLGPCHLLLWHPVLDGAQQLDQFLRVATVGRAAQDASRPSTEALPTLPTLRQRLAEGHAVEAAGYRVGPGIAAALDTVKLRPCPAAHGQARVVWLDVSATSPPTLRPASHVTLQAWREAGWQVEAHAVSAPMFWQTPEMEDAPALLQATTEQVAPHTAPVHTPRPAPMAFGPSLSEEAVSFACGSHTLIGVVHHAAVRPASDLGLVVLVGGPQVRVGSHRLFLQLARACAAAGITTLRFDVRGMGDSAETPEPLPGTNRPQAFDAQQDDITAALDALQQAAPRVRRVVLWGLCDGASAALLQVHQVHDPRVVALHLVNPWVRSAHTLAQTHLRHHYLQRLLQPEFWAKVRHGQVGWANLRGLADTVRRARKVSTAAAADFPQRMALGLQRFTGPVHITLSGQDHTAQEFELHVRQAPEWRTALKRPTVRWHHQPQADHTFSQAGQAQALIHDTVQGLKPLLKGPVSLTTHPRVSQVPSSGLALMEHAARHTVYAHPQWWTLFENTVVQPQGGRSLYACLHRGGRVRVVLPLLLQPAFTSGLRGLAERWIKGPQIQALSNYYTGLYTLLLDPQAHPEEATEDLTLLFRELQRTLPPRTRLALGPLAEDEAGLVEAALRANGRQPRRHPAFANWHQAVAPGEQGFEAYWAERPSSLRNTVRRAAQKFKAAGGTLEVTDGLEPAALGRARQAYEQVYARSWKPPEAYTDFIPGLMHLAAQQGWLRLGVAWLNGQPIAAHLWLVSGAGPTRRAEIFKLAYDEAAKEWSAGSLLGHALMRHVIVQDRVHEVDYLSGDDGYKALWMGGRRVRWSVVSS